ncbi:MAG: hypothetical protein WAK51_13690 [Opitutaceae bacterium]|jgi:hypothetical protein
MKDLIPGARIYKGFAPAAPGHGQGPGNNQNESSLHRRQCRCGQTGEANSIFPEEISPGALLD